MNKTLKDVLFVVGSLILGFILITVIVLAFYLPRYFLDNTKVGLAEEETEEITVMSKALGSLHYKICVYVILKEISTGKEFIVFNTHPDNQSDEARVNGIKVVLDKIAEFGDLPSFLMDDLNAEPDSVTIASALENFDDSARLAGVSEDAPTFHGWGEEAESQRIDYILTSKYDFEVSEYRVYDNLHEDAYSGDHCPIYIKVKLK